MWCIFAQVVTCAHLIQAPTDAVSLAAHLREVEARNAQLDTSIEMKIYETTAADAEAAAEGHALGVRSIRLLAARDRWRLEIEARRPDSTVELNAVYVWDGEKCVSRVISDRGIVIHQRFKYPQGMEILALMNLNGTAQIPGTSPLSELVQSSDFLHHRAQAEGDHVYVLQTPLADGANMRREVRITLSPVEDELLPSTLEIEIWKTESNESHKWLGLERWRVLRWGEFDGKAFPLEATREVVRQLPSDRERVRGVTTLRRIEISPPDQELDPALFKIEARMGETVVDERINAAVTLGERRLWFDGVLYEFDEPITEYPIPNIEEQLLKGRIIQVPTGGGGRAGNRGRQDDRAVIKDSGPVWRSLCFAGAFVLLIASGGVLLRRACER